MLTNQVAITWPIVAGTRPCGRSHKGSATRVENFLLQKKVQKTFLMIKPDAVQRNLIGEILTRVEKAGFEIVELRMVKLSPHQAKRFYRVHRGKTFFDKLVKYVSSGKVVVTLLKKKNAERAYSTVKNWETWIQFVDIIQMNTQELYYFTGRMFSKEEPTEAILFLLRKMQGAR